MDAKIKSAKNPRWANAEKTRIDIDVDFDHLDEAFVPFTADPGDIEKHGKVLFDDAKAGKYGPVGDFVAPPVAQPKPTLADRVAALEEKLK